MYAHIPERSRLEESLANSLSDLNAVWEWSVSEAQALWQTAVVSERTDLEPLRAAMKAATPLEFNRALDQLRIQAGLSLRKAEVRGRVSRSTVHRLATKPTLPRESTLRLLLVAYSSTDTNLWIWCFRRIQKGLEPPWFADRPIPSTQTGSTTERDVTEVSEGQSSSWFAWFARSRPDQEESDQLAPGRRRRRYRRRRPASAVLVYLLVVVTIMALPWPEDVLFRGAIAFGVSGALGCGALLYRRCRPRTAQPVPSRWFDDEVLDWPDLTQWPAILGKDECLCSQCQTRHAYGLRTAETQRSGDALRRSAFARSHVRSNRALAALD